MRTHVSWKFGDPKSAYHKQQSIACVVIHLQVCNYFYIKYTNTCVKKSFHDFYMDCVKRIWYLSPMPAAKVQASLRIRAVSPEPSLLAHTSSESRGTFRQKARSLAPQNGWACAVKICHDGMLEDTNSLDEAHMKLQWQCKFENDRPLQYQ